MRRSMKGSTAMDDRERKKLIAKLNAGIEVLTRARDDLVALSNSLEGVHPVKRALEIFDHQWMRRYDSDDHYSFNPKTDPMNTKRLLTRLGEDELHRRIFNYFNDRDEWLVRQKHPFSIFVSRINTYVKDRGLTPWTGDSGEPAPADCAHAPRCRTEVEHTERRRQELSQ
jgi:hypothetical protein